MSTMNARLVPILMISVMLVGNIRPFSQNAINTLSSTLIEDSEASVSAKSIETGSGQEETKKKPTESSDEDSDTSHPSTQGETFSAVVVEMPGRTLRLFPVNRMVKSSINRPVIVWSLAHAMDVKLTRVQAVERCATFSLSVVAPSVQSHAPPTTA